MIREKTQLQQKLQEWEKSESIEEKQAQKIQEIEKKFEEEIKTLKLKLDEEKKKTSDLKEELGVLGDKHSKSNNNMEKVENSSKILKEENQAQTKEIKSLNNTITILQDQLAQQRTISESVKGTENEGALDLLKDTLSEILESGETMLKASFTEEKHTLESKIQLLEQHTLEFRTLIQNKNTELKDKEAALEARIEELEEALDLSVKKYKKIKRLLKESLDKQDELKLELRTVNDKLKDERYRLKEFEDLIKQTKF